MTPKITDIWFRSKLPLTEIARRLGLRDVTDDAENYWEWVSGTLDDIRLSITRTHTQPAERVDTRIFIPGANEFSAVLLAELVERLQSFVSGTVVGGRWTHRAGNEFDLVAVREFNHSEVQ